MTFRFTSGYYVRALANTVLALLIGLALLWLSWGMDSNNWGWLKLLIQFLGFFLILGSVLGLVGVIIGIFITRRTILRVDNGAIKLISGRRELFAFSDQVIQGICLDYETIAPTARGLRFNSAKPTALRIFVQDKTYLVLTSRMYEDDLKKLTATISEQLGVSVHLPKVGPEICTFPTNKYERGESGWLIFTSAFLAGYKDIATRSPVLREGVVHLFLPTNQIQQAEPASSFDLPDSTGSGRTALLRIILKDETTKEISLGFAARTTGPDYRKVLQRWVNAIRKSL